MHGLRKDASFNMCVCARLRLAFCMLWFSKPETFSSCDLCYLIQCLKSEADLVTVPIQKTLSYSREVSFHLTWGSVKKILPPSFSCEM